MRTVLLVGVPLPHLALLAVLKERGKMSNYKMFTFDTDQISTAKHARKVKSQNAIDQMMLKRGRKKGRRK